MNYLSLRAELRNQGMLIVSRGIAKPKEGEGEQKNHRKNKKNAKNIQYSFGQRFYYWTYFENNNNEDWESNPGYKYKDWFISPKYSNLKEECFENNIYFLILSFQLLRGARCHVFYLNSQ